MKKYFVKTGILAAVLSMGMTGMVMAKEAQIGPGWVKETKEEPKSGIEALEKASDTDQIILVTGKDDGSSQITVSYHKKDEAGAWNQIFTTEGLYGRKGASYEKVEGDQKTPLGTYQFTMAFGLLDNPGSKLPFHKIEQGDFWVDDGNSAHYNRLVNTNTTAKDWNSAENLMAMAPYYNYGLVLNYNPDCVPGKGSAIFLHCTRPGEEVGSAGCIKIPEELMVTLLQSVDEKTKIVLKVE